MKTKYNGLVVVLLMIIGLLASACGEQQARVTEATDRVPVPDKSNYFSSDTNGNRRSFCWARCRREG